MLCTKELQQLQPTEREKSKKIRINFGVDLQFDYLEMEKTSKTWQKHIKNLQLEDILTKETGNYKSFNIIKIISHKKYENFKQKWNESISNMWRKDLKEILYLLPPLMTFVLDKQWRKWVFCSCCLSGFMITFCWILAFSWFRHKQVSCFDCYFLEDPLRMFLFLFLLLECGNLWYLNGLSIICAVKAQDI